MVNCRKRQGILLYSEQTHQEKKKKKVNLSLRMRDSKLRPSSCASVFGPGNCPWLCLPWRGFLSRRSFLFSGSPQVILCHRLTKPALTGQMPLVRCLPQRDIPATPSCSKHKPSWPGLPGAVRAPLHRCWSVQTLPSWPLVAIRQTVRYQHGAVMEPCVSERHFKSYEIPKYTYSVH